MKRQINTSAFEKWARAVGGSQFAIAKIVEKTGISVSTAEKIVSGRYISSPPYLVRKALGELLSREPDDLFPERDSGEDDEAAS